MLFCPVRFWAHAVENNEVYSGEKLLHADKFKYTPINAGGFSLNRQANRRHHVPMHQIGTGSHPTRYAIDIPRTYSLGVKRPGREGEHSQPDSHQARQCKISNFITLQLYQLAPIARNSLRWRNELQFAVYVKTSKHVLAKQKIKR